MMSEALREAEIEEVSSESLRARLSGLEALEREFEEMRKEAAKTIQLAESFRDPMPGILTQELVALWDVGRSSDKD